jgi:hypothetical protein
MTRVGISITKSTPFRNATQEFSNVYYYDGLAGDPSVSGADALIDELVTKEKTLHATNVTFVRGRLWRQTGDKSTTEMISQKNLSGTGSKAPSTNFDKERALLYRLRAGVDSRGNPVYFRKWYHVMCDPSGTGYSAAELEQTAAFSSGRRGTLVTALPAIGSIGSGGTLGTLCSKNGRLSTAGANWEVHAYLEHHQLGDMWRAQ